MEQEKLYVIEEKTYEAHIDEEVHLYGLLHQLAFLAGKIKNCRDMEKLIDTAWQYGDIADQMFDRWSIPARYLVFSLSLIHIFRMFSFSMAATIG